MIRKKTSLFLLFALAITSAQMSCGVVSKQKQKEEMHNAATQTIPTEAKDILGRWDLTVDRGTFTVPSWLEIKLSGFNTLVGSFVADGGSSRPVSQIHLVNGKFSFEIPPQWEGGAGLFKVEGALVNNVLQGTITSNKGNVFNFSGEKAPYLIRQGEARWGNTIDLFNGKDLSGWKPSAGTNQWTVKSGILTNQTAGANLITDQKFEDFKLVAEFRYAKGGNSGIYLRGRYEVQIEDSPKDKHPGSLYFGGVYGFLSPSVMATKGAGEWNRYEITLRGRMVTVVANGITIINNQEIPGITGGALDSKEGEAGPIYLQGDHTGVEFRKISITPAL